MKKDIERKFLATLNADISWCVTYIHERYDEQGNERQDWNGQTWGNTLNDVSARADAIDARIIASTMDEIEDNIRELRNNEQDTKDYIFWLLNLLKDFSFAFHPKSAIGNKESLAVLEELVLTPDKWNNDPLLPLVNELLGHVSDFANLLDGMCAKYGIDLMELQDISGICIKEKYSVEYRTDEIWTSAAMTPELAKEYLSRIKDKNEQKKPSTTDIICRRPEEVRRVFGSDEDCEEFFKVEKDHTPAWWAHRTTEYVKSGKIEIEVLNGNFGLRLKKNIPN